MEAAAYLMILLCGAVQRVVDAPAGVPGGDQRVGRAGGSRRAGLWEGGRARRPMKVQTDGSISARRRGLRDRPSVNTSPSRVSSTHPSGVGGNVSASIPSASRRGLASPSGMTTRCSLSGGTGALSCEPPGGTCVCRGYRAPEPASCALPRRWGPPFVASGRTASSVRSVGPRSGCAIGRKAAWSCHASVCASRLLGRRLALCELVGDLPAACGVAGQQHHPLLARPRDQGPPAVGGDGLTQPLVLVGVGQHHDLREAIPSRRRCSGTFRARQGVRYQGGVRTGLFRPV